MAPEAVLQDPTRLEAPLDFASLKEVHRGSQGTLIIHIQDAHSNLSGQQNLASTLDYLMSKYGLSLVLVEGSSKEATLTPLKKAVSPQVCKQLAKSLLMEGQLAGEEYLNLVSDHPMKIMGVENRSLYFKSVENYAALADKREEILLYLKSIQRALDKLKTRLYSKELLNYEKNTKDFETNFKALLELAQAKSIDLSKFPNIQKLIGLEKREQEIDFEQANLEQAALLEEIQNKGAGEDLGNYLKKANQAKNSKASQFTFFENTFNIAKEKNILLSQYPNLVSYGDYLRSFSEIDLDQALDEFLKAEDKIYIGLLPEKDERLIRAIDRYVKLLDTAYRIQMTTKDFKLFEANEPDFSTMAYLAFINRKLAEFGFFDDLIPYKDLLEEGKKALEGFYDSVAQRDIAFIQNTDRILKEQNQKVAVLISGGYHTPHLKELFQKKGYSYAVLTPIVTSETNQRKYEKLLLSPIRKEIKTLEATQMRSKPDESLGALGKDFAFLKKKEGVRALGAAGRLELGSPVEKFIAEGIRLGIDPEVLRQIQEEFRARPENPSEIGIDEEVGDFEVPQKVGLTPIISQPAPAAQNSAVGARMAAVDESFERNFLEQKKKSGYQAAFKGVEAILSIVARSWGIDEEKQIEIRDALDFRVVKDGKFSGASYHYVVNGKSRIILASQDPSRDAFEIAAEVGHAIHSAYGLQTSPIGNIHASVAEAYDTAAHLLISSLLPGHADYMKKNREYELIGKYALDYLSVIGRESVPYPGEEGAFDFFKGFADYLKLRGMDAQGIERMAIDSHYGLNHFIGIYIFMTLVGLHGGNLKLAARHMGRALKNQAQVDFKDPRAFLRSVIRMDSRIYEDLERRPIWDLAWRALSRYQANRRVPAQTPLPAFDPNEFFSGLEDIAIPADGSVVLLGNQQAAFRKIVKLIVADASPDNLLSMLENLRRQQEGELMQMTYRPTPKELLIRYLTEDLWKSDSGARMAANHIDALAGELSIGMQEEFGVQPSQIKRALVEALGGPSTYSVSYGMDSTDPQRALIEKDVENFIQDILSENRAKKIFVTSVGFGNAPLEIMELIEIIYTQLLKAGQDASAWEVRLVGMDAHDPTYEQATKLVDYFMKKASSNGGIERFSEAVVQSELRKISEYFDYQHTASSVSKALLAIDKIGNANLKVRLFLADARIEEQVKKVRNEAEVEFGGNFETDYILERRVSYSAAWASEFNAEKDLARMVKSFLISRNLIRSFGKENTRYVNETYNEEFNYDHTIIVPVSRFPGSTILTAKHYFPERHPAGYPEHAFANIGSGIQVISKETKQMTLAQYLTVTRESARSGARMAMDAKATLQSLKEGAVSGQVLTTDGVRIDTVTIYSIRGPGIDISFGSNVTLTQIRDKIDQIKVATNTELSISSGARLAESAAAKRALFRIDRLTKAMALRWSKEEGGKLNPQIIRVAAQRVVDELQEPMPALVTLQRLGNLLERSTLRRLQTPGFKGRSPTHRKLFEIFQAALESIAQDRKVPDREKPILAFSLLEETVQSLLAEEKAGKDVQRHLRLDRYRFDEDEIRWALGVTRVVELRWPSLWAQALAYLIELKFSEKRHRRLVEDIVDLVGPEKAYEAVSSVFSYFFAKTEQHEKEEEIKAMHAVVRALDARSAHLFTYIVQTIGNIQDYPTRQKAWARVLELIRTHPEALTRTRLLSVIYETGSGGQVTQASWKKFVRVNYSDPLTESREDSEPVIPDVIPAYRTSQRDKSSGSPDVFSAPRVGTREEDTETVIIPPNNPEGHYEQRIRQALDAMEGMSEKDQARIFLSEIWPAYLIARVDGWNGERLQDLVSRAARRLDMSLAIDIRLLMIIEPDLVFRRRSEVFDISKRIRNNEFLRRQNLYLAVEAISRHNQAGKIVTVLSSVAHEVDAAPGYDVITGPIGQDTPRTQTEIRYLGRRVDRLDTELASIAFVLIGDQYGVVVKQHLKNIFYQNVLPYLMGRPFDAITGRSIHPINDTMRRALLRDFPANPDPAQIISALERFYHIFESHERQHLEDLLRKAYPRAHRRNFPAYLETAAYLAQIAYSDAPYTSLVEIIRLYIGLRSSLLILSDLDGRYTRAMDTILEELALEWGIAAPAEHSSLDFANEILERALTLNGPELGALARNLLQRLLDGDVPIRDLAVDTTQRISSRPETSKSPTIPAPAGMHFGDRLWRFIESAAMVLIPVLLIGFVLVRHLGDVSTPLDGPVTERVEQRTEEPSESVEATSESLFELAEPVSVRDAWKNKPWREFRLKENEKKKASFDSLARAIYTDSYRGDGEHYDFDWHEVLYSLIADNILRVGDGNINEINSGEYVIVRNRYEPGFDAAYEEELLSTRGAIWYEARTAALENAAQDESTPSEYARELERRARAARQLLEKSGARMAQLPNTKLVEEVPVAEFQESTSNLRQALGSIYRAINGMKYEGIPVSMSTLQASLRVIQIFINKWGNAYPIERIRMAENGMTKLNSMLQELANKSSSIFMERDRLDNEEIQKEIEDPLTKSFIVVDKKGDSPEEIGFKEVSPGTGYYLSPLGGYLIWLENGVIVAIGGASIAPFENELNEIKKSESGLLLVKDQIVKIGFTEIVPGSGIYTRIQGIEKSILVLDKNGNKILFGLDRGWEKASREFGFDRQVRVKGYRSFYDSSGILMQETLRLQDAYMEVEITQYGGVVSGSLKPTSNQEIPIDLDPEQLQVTPVGLMETPDPVIQNLEIIAGKSIKDEIEPAARPGVASGSGFLSEKERLVEDVLLPDRKFVREKGFTHQQLAEPLFYAMNLLRRYRATDIPEFFYRGQRYKVQATRWRGYQYSIIGDEPPASADYVVSNLENKKEVRFSALVPYFIMRYGFYEGHTSYRVEPQDIINVFEPGLRGARLPASRRDFILSMAAAGVLGALPSDTKALPLNARAYDQLDPDQKSALNDLASEIASKALNKDPVIGSLFGTDEWKTAFHIVADTDAVLHGGGVGGDRMIGLEEGMLNWLVTGDPAAHSIAIRTLVHEAYHYLHFKNGEMQARPTEEEENITRIESLLFFDEMAYRARVGDREVVFGVIIVTDRGGSPVFRDGKLLTFIGAYRQQIPQTDIDRAVINEIRAWIDRMNPDQDVRVLLENDIRRLQSLSGARLTTAETKTDKPTSLLEAAQLGRGSLEKSLPTPQILKGASPEEHRLFVLLAQHLSKGDSGLTVELPYLITAKDESYATMIYGVEKGPEGGKVLTLTAKTENGEELVYHYPITSEEFTAKAVGSPDGNTPGVIPLVLSVDDGAFLQSTLIMENLSLAELAEQFLNNLQSNPARVKDAHEKLMLAIVTNDSNQDVAEALLKELEKGLPSFLNGKISVTLAQMKDERLSLIKEVPDGVKVLVFADATDRVVREAVAGRGYGLVSAPSIKPGNDSQTFSAPNYLAAGLFRALFSGVSQEDVSTIVGIQKDVVEQIFNNLFKRTIPYRSQIRFIQAAIRYEPTTLQEDESFFKQTMLPLIAKLTQSIFSAASDALMRAIGAAA